MKEKSGVQIRNWFLLLFHYRCIFDWHWTCMLPECYSQNQFSCERYYSVIWYLLKVFKSFLIYILFYLLLTTPDGMKPINDKMKVLTFETWYPCIFLCDLWTLMAVSLKDEPDRNVTSFTCRTTNFIVLYCYFFHFSFGILSITCLYIHCN